MEKIVLDGCVQELAASPLPYDDRGNGPVQVSPRSSSLYPFGGPCDPRESTLRLSYLADMGNYEEACSCRLKDGQRKDKREKGEPRRSRGSGEGKKEKK